MKSVIINDKIKDMSIRELSELTVKKLIEKGLRISFAESCTGGLVSAALVSVADASKVFDVAVVTYANEAKVCYLGVDEETIACHGVVSEEVARQMAYGAATNNAAQVSIATTGVAGPGGGTEKKPVGMVCFGFYYEGELYSDTVKFGDIGRNNVREESVKHAYRVMLTLLSQ